MINIIIIEDSEDDYKYLADAIHRYAEQSGEVFSVKHYVSALLFLNEYKADADIIFMDIHMPVMDGVTATKEIRAMGITTPIIALTANVIKEDMDNFIASGMNSNIAKPINFDKLQEVLLQYLKAWK